MNLTTDLTGLFRALEEMREDDWGAILIAADAAAEAGELELEAGLRWCARSKKWPRRVSWHVGSNSADATIHDAVCSWHWSGARRAQRDCLPQNLDRWLGPAGYHDPELSELIRRTGEGILALGIPPVVPVAAADPKASAQPRTILK